MFILSHSGDIVYHPRQQLIYGNLKSERIPEILTLRDGNLRTVVDGRPILYTVVSSKDTGWVVVAVSYLDELFRASREAEYVFLMLSLLVLVGAVAAGMAVSSNISRPIESLRRSMQAVENGNFDIDITVNARNEVYQLARDCDIAVKKIRDLMAQNREEQEIKRKLELRSLQAQINPHFLYNTLDSIIWMIELGENERAIDMTSSLARFFRIGISRGEETISVTTEIEYMETYLGIQKQRYKDKLSYEILFARSSFLTDPQASPAAAGGERDLPWDQEHRGAGADPHPGNEGGAVHGDPHQRQRRGDGARAARRPSRRADRAAAEQRRGSEKRAGAHPRLFRARIRRELRERPRAGTVATVRIPMIEGSPP